MTDVGFVSELSDEEWDALPVLVREELALVYGVLGDFGLDLHALAGQGLSREEFAARAEEVHARASRRSSGFTLTQHVVFWLLLSAHVGDLVVRDRDLVDLVSGGDPFGDLGGGE